MLLLLATCSYPLIALEWNFRRLGNEYVQRQRNYDAVAQRLSAQMVDSREMERFFIQADRNPDSLRKLRPEELGEVQVDFLKRGCLIMAYRDSDGSVVAFLVCRDLGGTGGAQGLVYSVNAPTPGQFGLGSRHYKVATNWWAAWY